MLRDVSYDKYITEVNQQLGSGGAFLTVKDEKLNAMTIGWGFVGYMWARPIFVVPVRKSRFTYGLIEKSGEFTVSIPFNKLKQELKLCGTRSGCDTNKFEEFGLVPLNGKVVNTPIVDGCDLYYECKIVYKQEMNPQFLEEAYDSRCYANKDYHTFYYGEIVACYKKE